MAGPGAVLFNHETNTYDEVPAEQVGAAIASGRYTSSGASTSTQAEGGLVTRPVEQLGAAATQGETEAGGANAARAAGERRSTQMQLDSDKFLSFAEGAGDALTLGLMHGTTERDELRREADSGSALLGQLVGTAIGLKFPGPLRGLASGGEKAGESLARALLGEAETGFRGVVTRGLAEAGANSALMAASAFGHQITDAVIADKPFAAESIAAEAGVGALLGFGFGFAGSSFGQLAKASRAAVEASGVATKESSAALSAVGDLTRTWDDAIEQHARRAGVLKVLAEDGHIPITFVEERVAAVREAERARDALRSIDSERALGGDAKEYQKWRRAVEDYDGAARALDERMTPGLAERASLTPVTPGPAIHPDYMPGGYAAKEGKELAFRAAGGRPSFDVDAAEAAKGLQSPMSTELDKGMRGAGDDWTQLKGATGEELKAKYAEIYDRPFEDTPGTAIGEENLGGKKSATSEVGTNVGRGRRVVNQEPALPGVLDKAEMAPAGVAETGRDFVDSAKKELNARPPGPGESATANPHTGNEGKRAVKDYLDNWFKDYDAKPRISLGDQMQVQLTQALDNIAKVSGGRLDSAGGLALFKSLGLKEATSPLGQRLDQVWSLGQAGKFAADEARGVATPLRKGLVGQLQGYATRRGARAVGAAAFGGAVGGPMGAIVGMALTSAGFAGAAASTAGKLMTQISTVGEALLKGRRATIVARVVAGNRPYQYSDAGELKDPVQRIVEIQRLAANPDAIRARVTRQLGDLALTSPEMTHHLTETTVNHIQAISGSAPAIMLTPLGQPIRPSGTALNRFFDFENAMHDLPGTLQAIANGNASATQIKALHIGYPAVHGELVRGVLGQEQGLDQLNAAKVRAVERALGIPLTRSTSDPTVTSRYQSNWSAPAEQPRPAQSFKITAPKPTPTQAAGGGRAPGNERISR